MDLFLRRIAAWAGIGWAVVSASCSTPLCQTGSYDRGTGICPADRYAVAVSLDSDRTDLRSAPASLVIRVQATATDLDKPFDLVEVPATVLSFDSTPDLMVSSTIGDDLRSVLVARSPEPLKLGALRAQVTLPGLSPAQTTLPHRVFRSPKLGPMEVVSGTMSPNYSGTVQGRVAVQIASPFGVAGQLLITDEVSFLGTPQRWLDLYAQNSMGMLGYVDSAPWRTIARKMIESNSAQLALVPGAIVIYDLDTGRMQRDLSLVPLGGTRQSQLSKVEPQLPVDAIAMAASSEDSAVLLARASEVRVFRTDPTPAARAVLYLGTLSGLSGPPVVAAHDLRASKVSSVGADYFAIVWESDGKGTLLVLNKTADVPSGISPVAVNSGVGVAGITAAALADLDSDGLQDLIFAQADGALRWSPQHPDGSFVGNLALEVSAPGAVSISVGDINGDFLPDIAVATKGKQVMVFRNQP